MEILCTGGGDQNHPKEKAIQESKWLSEESLLIQGPGGCPLPALFFSFIILAHNVQFFFSLELSAVLIKYLCVFVSSLSLK